SRRLGLPRRAPSDRRTTMVRLPRSTMLKLQPGARAYLTEIRALTTDEDGNDRFVGLTTNESMWYQNYLRESFSGTADRADESVEKYLALQDKHEEMRRTVLAGESLLRPLSS